MRRLACVIIAVACNAPAHAQAAPAQVSPPLELVQGVFIKIADCFSDRLLGQELDQDPAILALALFAECEGQLKGYRAELLKRGYRREVIAAAEIKVRQVLTRSLAPEFGRRTDEVDPR